MATYEDMVANFGRRGADMYRSRFNPQTGQMDSPLTPSAAPVNAEAEKAKQNVYSGSDFSGYQNQLNSLLQNPSSIQQDPSYQFRLGQGQQAIERSAAARGMGNSGNVLAELAKYGQGMASEEYGNQFNRLKDLMRGSQQFGLASEYYKPKRPNVGWSMSTEPSWY